MFFDHLRIAIELHDPKDVYIVEHRNCGAYKKFLGLEFDDDEASQGKERAAHKKQADALAKVIADWCVKESERTGKKVELRVRSFLTDLRGDVELIGGADEKPARKTSPGKKAARKR